MSKFRILGILLVATFITLVHAAADCPTPTLRLADAAIADQDDMCVWIHPTDPPKSVVVTSDKKANKLFVYDLDGKTIQSVDVKQPGNIDSRYGFPLAGGKVDIVVVNLRHEKTLAVFKIDSRSCKLTRIDDGAISTGNNYGGCLYRSKKSGKFFAVVTSKAGEVTQYELNDVGTGKVQGKKVRAWKVGGVCEGAVADDETGKLYIAEEHAGVWELGGEPDDASPGTIVIKVGENELKGDVEGLAIFTNADGKGYLLVSDQGKDKVRVYRREGKHEYVGAFTLAGMGEQDGIEVVSVGLGPKYPNGLFLCHTGSTTPCPVLLTPWDAIAKTFTPPLALPAQTMPRK
jgi:3-phytase